MLNSWWRLSAAGQTSLCILSESGGRLRTMKKKLNFDALNFDAMSVDEIWLLHERIIKDLSARLTSEKRELEMRLANLRLKSVPPVARGRQKRESQQERRKY